MQIIRRNFLHGLTAAGVAGSALGASTQTRTKWTIAAFTKPFQQLSYGKTAEIVADIGFDGIEATVRGGGQVLPENVGRDLPPFAAAMTGSGLELTGMATDIKSAGSTQARAVLETAAQLGFKHYRMDYFRYDLKKPIPPQIDRFRREAEGLAKMNAAIGIQGLYQNHAGTNYVGAGLWDLDRILSDCDPAHLGVAFDLRHAKVEAGMSWPVGFSLLKPRTGMLYVKDFRWEDDQVVNLPLGEGVVGSDFYRSLVTEGTVLPVSLHIEYGNHRDADEAAKGLRDDIKTLRSWLG